MGKLAQWLPSMTVQLARTVGLKYNQAAFRVAPSMTKFEIKSYLERVYGVGVVRVDTMNYNGKAKRGVRGVYERRDFKKAIVTINSPFTFPEPPVVPEPVVPEPAAAAADAASAPASTKS